MDFLGLHKMQTDNFLNPEKENKYGHLACFNFFIQSLVMKIFWDQLFVQVHGE
jgi:hypothetical protein